jgi:hypothetical protein
VQLPLLKHISKERMLSEVDPKKVSWFCFVWHLILSVASIQLYLKI